MTNDINTQIFLDTFEVEELLPGEHAFLEELAIPPSRRKRATPQIADDHRNLRCSIIRSLILGSYKTISPKLRSLRIVGYNIIPSEQADLDLSGIATEIGLEFSKCRFCADLKLDHFVGSQITIFSSVFETGLKAERVKLSTDFIVKRSSLTTDLKIILSNISGDLVLDGMNVGKSVNIERNNAGEFVYLTGSNVAGNVIVNSGDVRKSLICSETQVGGDFQAASLVVDGDLSLEDASIGGALSLFETKIGGKLNCHGARIGSKQEERAIMADRLSCKTGVYFRKSPKRTPQVIGAISMQGIDIEGDLAFDDTLIEGTTDTLKTINLTGARIGRNFFVQGQTKIKGTVKLNAAKVGQLIDNLNCWPKKDESLDLNQFTYEALSGVALTASNQRLRWLAKQETDKQFFPQPYEQCAKVLWSAGHRQDARSILAEKEKLQHEQNKLIRLRTIKLKRNILCYFWHYAMCLWEFLLRTVFGWIVFGMADWTNQIKPNNAFVLRAHEWTGCALAEIEVSQRECFEKRAEGFSYPKFAAYTYSIDTLVPLVSLEMQEYWIPDENHPYGRAARYYLWIHIGLGWFLSVLALAGVSGLVRKI